MGLASLTSTTHLATNAREEIAVTEFVASVRRVLNPNGHVLLKTILPTLGEVLWWQQMEFECPLISPQATLEKMFFKHGLSLRYGQRDYGSYLAVKWRTTSDPLRQAFTWLIDFPMMLAYYLLAPKRRLTIDQSLQHKMVTQVWEKTGVAADRRAGAYTNYEIGTGNQSMHFELEYNGYLRRKG